VRGELTVPRTELIYELAFLKAFNHWENFLEAVFLRYLCGYHFNGYAETPRTTFAHSIADAMTRVYQGQQYLLWHNPTKVISRANEHFIDASAARPARIAFVLNSALHQLQCFASTRHRIAHVSLDSKLKFDAASLALVGRRFPASRPGKLLREQTTFNSQQVRWLERLLLELGGLASQLAG
jgi:hypothetical protein